MFQVRCRIIDSNHIKDDQGLVKVSYGTEIRTTSPADKKPLYKPWFAARVLVDSAYSFVILKAARPFGVAQRNISRFRM